MSALHGRIHPSCRALRWDEREVLNTGQVEWKGRIKGKLVGMKTNTNMSEKVGNYEKQVVWNRNLLNYVV